MIKNLKRRQRKIRSKISGTNLRPRMSVYKSNNNIEVQLIDDVAKTTIIGLGSINNKELLKIKNRKERYFELGKLLAKNAISKNISTVTFDRRGRKYHGLIKSVAEGAREAGLKF